jgi:hypothetical protein
LARTHFNQQLAFNIASEKSVRTVVYGIDCCRVGKHGDRGFHRARKLRRGRRHFGTGIGQRLGLLGCAIPHRHFVPDFHEPGCNGCAHDPETCNANAHASSLDALLPTIGDHGRALKPPCALARLDSLTSNA